MISRTEQVGTRIFLFWAVAPSTPWKGCLPWRGCCGQCSVDQIRLARSCALPRRLPLFWTHCYFHLKQRTLNNAASQYRLTTVLAPNKRTIGNISFPNDFSSYSHWRNSPRRCYYWCTDCGYRDVQHCHLGWENIARFQSYKLHEYCCTEA